LKVNRDKYLTTHNTLTAKTSVMNSKTKWWLNSLGWKTDNFDFCNSARPGTEVVPRIGTSKF
jgi:hypothetical protein